MSFRRSYLLAFSFLATACQQAAVCPNGSSKGNGECVTDTATSVERVRLTHLDVKYDLAEPVYVNNRVPITFGLTAEGKDAANPGTRHVAVSFSFVEANPTDPANPLGCASSAVDVEVTTDGKEQIFDGYIWPTTLCATLAEKNTEVNIQVDFDGGADIAPEIASDLDAPSVVFSDARRGDALNQLCRGSLDNTNPMLGCVYAIDLQPTPTNAQGTLIDVRYGLSATSSVAVLPIQQTADVGPNGLADVDPTLVVQSSFVVNGKDPYISPIDPALIPQSLIDAVPTIKEDLKFGLNDAERAAINTLPGKATVSYTIRAATDKITQLPLSVRDPANPKTKVAKVAIDGIMPGTANITAHELYLEGATLDAVSSGGIWANENNFVVRGCFNAEFPQEGNRGDGYAGSCRDLEVVLARAPSNLFAISSRSFNKEFARQIGSDRIGIESAMATQNRLDQSGSFSRTEGEVVLNGKLGKSFDLSLARAFANASIGINPAHASFDLGLDAFGQRIYGVSAEQELKIVQTEDFSAAKTFTIGSLGFGFGPVTVGFKIGVGGAVGFSVEDTLEVLTDNTACQDLLKSADTITTCGRMTRVTSPNFGLAGNIEGGIDLRIVKAAVVADLRFVTTSFPLEATLGWGLTDAQKLLVRGDVNWDMSFEPISGDVAIVGKVGIRRFAKSLKVNLFSFSSPTITTRLLSHSMASFEEVQ